MGFLEQLSTFIAVSSSIESVLMSLPSVTASSSVLWSNPASLSYVPGLEVLGTQGLGLTLLVVATLVATGVMKAEVMAVEREDGRATNLFLGP